MPYQIEWEPSGVVARFTGVFDLETSRQADNEFYFDPRSNTIKYAIWDLSKIERMDMTLVQTELPAVRDKICSNRISELKFGMIVSDDQSAAILMEYVDVSIKLGSPWQFYIERSLEEIRAWIEMPLNNQ